MSDLEDKESPSNKRQISPLVFTSASLGLLLTGSVTGLAYVVKHEPHKLLLMTKHSDRDALKITFKALMYGTLLSCGTFLGVTCFAAAALRIKSADDLRTKLGTILITDEERLKRKASLEKDIKEVSGMTLTQEMEHFWSKFSSDDPKKSDS